MIVIEVYLLPESFADLTDFAPLKLLEIAPPIFLDADLRPARIVEPPGINPETPATISELIIGLRVETP